MFKLSFWIIDKVKTTDYGSGGWGFESLQVHVDNQAFTKQYL